MSKYNLSETPTIWDAKQLIKSYVSLFYFRKDLSDDSEFAKIPHSDQVRMKRLYSAICAFNNAEYDEGKVLSTIDETFGRFGLRSRHYSSEFKVSAKAKIAEIVKSKFCETEDWIQMLDNDRSFRPGSFFNALITYRLNLEKLINSYSGVKESSMSFALGYDFVKTFFSKDLEKKSEILDEMLALLLGEQFQNKSFTEEELKANWHFATETDSDLLDWDVDNF